MRGFLCYLLAALLGLAAPVPALAQGPVPGGRPFPFDSLQATVQQPGLADTLRVYRALEAYQALIYTRPDSAPRYVAQALALARRIHFANGEANAYGALAGLHYQAKRYAQAQRYYELELRTARQARLPLLESSAYASLADLALSAGNVPLGEEYYGRAYAVLQRLPRRHYNNEVLMLYNWSDYYLDHQAPARAAPLVRQAVALLPRCTWPELPASVALLLGRVQALRHQPDSARLAWQRAARLATAGRFDQTAIEAHNFLAQLYLAQQRPALALAEVRQALPLARHSQELEAGATATALLARALFALHQPAAFDTLQLAQVLRDTVLARQNLAALNQAQARFHDREQQALIKALEQDRRLARQQQELTSLRARQQLALALGGAGLLLLLAGAGFWQYRQRQQATARTLRTRLAADLHDDVGHLLTQVAMQSSMLRETIPLPPPIQARLAALATTARHAVQQMTDVVWSLHEEVLTLPQLLARMHDHAHEVLPPAGLHIDFRVPDPLPALALPAELRHNLYLIYKEALHNIVKHAQATQATVTLAIAPTTLTLTVADDGPGHPLPTHPGGQGLRNMQARAQAVGGTVQHEARPTGFAVVVQVPV